MTEQVILNFKDKTAKQRFCASLIGNRDVEIQSLDDVVDVLLLRATRGEEVISLEDLKKEYGI